MISPNSKILVILRVLISLSLLALLLWLARKNLAKIGALLSAVNIFKFNLALLASLMSALFLAWRLKILLAAYQHFLTIKESLYLTLIGYFFANFMPSTIGGDLAKGYYLAKKVNNKLNPYASIFIDRVIGLVSLALIATVALLIARKEVKDRFIFWVIILLLLSCIVLLIFIFNKKLMKQISKHLGLVDLLQALKLEPLSKKAYNAVNIFINHKTKIFQAILLSLIAQFIAFVAVFLLSSSLSAYIPLAKIFLIMPVIAVLCMLPVTINGLGLREWAFVLFFSPYIGNTAALSLSILYLATSLLPSLSGGIIYLFNSHKLK